jgi:acetyl esterase
LKPQPKGALPPGLCKLFNECYCGSNVDKKNPLLSPLYATPEQLRLFPPTLIMTAGHDSLCAEAEEFGNKLQQAGVAVAHKSFKDSFHGFTLSRKPDAVEGWRMMIDHLNQCLHHS